MTKRRKPLNTQDLRTYAKENQIDVASDSALKNCGVFHPQTKDESVAAPEEVDVSQQASAEKPQQPAEPAPKKKRAGKSIRSIVESMVEAAAKEADLEPSDQPRARGAGSRKPLATRELVNYAQDNQIEIASESALKHCGVLQPDTSRQQSDLFDATVEMTPLVVEVSDYEPTVEMTLPDHQEETGLLYDPTVDMVKPKIQDKPVDSGPSFFKPATHEMFTPPPDVVAEQTWGSPQPFQPMQPPPLPPEVFSKPGPRKTRVQEFDIPKMVAENSPSPLPPQDEMTEDDAALEYFKGMAKGETYTAELRFRAKFAEESSAPPVVQEQAQPQIQQQADDTWNPAESFAPPEEEAARIHQFSNFNNMLDLVDERYQPLPSVNFQQGAQRQQAEVEVEFTQNSSKLSQRSGGLAGNLGAGNSKPAGKTKNRWAKK